MQPDGQRGTSGSDESAGAAAPADAQSFVGSRVGAYLITKRLGAGGVGEVFKGVDVMLKREVAIKVLRDELASDPVFLKRFSNEAQLHAKLSHPNVASVHAFLHEGDKQLMVMEYVSGISLEEFVRSGGPVPTERALGIFRRALDGIEHAHASGIVHRDIKPANIMLADNGQVKVMDFGIARALDSQEHLTRHGQVAGTAKSMSPEQIRGGQADVRSDIYSLGIVLYTLLAGRPPFEGKSDHALMLAQLEQAPPPLRSWVDNLPPKLEAAVMRALEKSPTARFQTVREFARALDACVPEAQNAPPKTRAPRDEQTSSRTVINPALQGAQRLPGSRAERPAKEPASPRATQPAARKLPWLDVRVSAMALGLLALLAGGTWLWPQLAQWVAPSVAPPQPVAAAAPDSRPPAAPPQAPPAAAAALPLPAQPLGPPADAIKTPTLAITRLGALSAGAEAAHLFKPGERIRLLITPSEDAHVYCYLQDETRRIVRFYPNRFSKGALVKTAAPLEIPGPMRFELLANKLNVAETIACFASPRDIIGELPPAVVGTDFAKLPAASLDEVRGAFARAVAEPLAEATFRVEPR